MTSTEPHAALLKDIEGLLRQNLEKKSKGDAGTVILLRAIRVLAESVQRASPDVLTRVAASPSDGAVLFELVSTPGLVPVEDPLASARARGARVLAELLSYGGESYTSTELEKVLGVTRQTLHEWRSAGKMLGLESGTGRRGVRFPRWQFDTERKSVIAGVSDALKALDTDDNWSALTFFVSPHSSLGGKRPIEALPERKDEVLRLAHAWRQQGPV